MCVCSCLNVEEQHLGSERDLKKWFWSVHMEVDRQLIFAARRLITGANVHRINTLIFQYEMAVRISNDDKTHGLEWQVKEYERRLRQVVQDGGLAVFGSKKSEWIELHGNESSDP
jgi:hypothetical protein